MTQRSTDTSTELHAELAPAKPASSLPAPFRVLYATDGSEPAHAAAEWLAQLPLPNGSTVRLVTVLADDSWEISPYLRQSEREWALRNFEEAEAILTRPEVEIRHTLLVGEPVHEILREAAATAEDLLVLGTHGRSGLAGLLLGSVALAVARRARQPVLVVRPMERPLSRVILGIDDSAHAQEAVKLLARLPLPAETRITVCHVVRPYTPLLSPGHLPSMWEVTEEPLRERLRAAEQLTGEASAVLAGAGRRVERTVREGDPASELVKLAEEQGAGLIVVGARGMSPARALLVGSVADRLLHGSHGSLLIVHTQ